jgi:hypothetical protein
MERTRTTDLNVHAPCFEPSLISGEPAFDALNAPDVDPGSTDEDSGESEDHSYDHFHDFEGPLRFLGIDEEVGSDSSPLVPFATTEAIRDTLATRLITRGWSVTAMPYQLECAVRRWTVAMKIGKRALRAHALSGPHTRVPNGLLDRGPKLPTLAALATTFADGRSFKSVVPTRVLATVRVPRCGFTTESLLLWVNAVHSAIHEAKRARSLLRRLHYAEDVIDGKLCSALESFQAGSPTAAVNAPLLRYGHRKIPADPHGRRQSTQPSDTGIGTLGKPTSGGVDVPPIGTFAPVAAASPGADVGSRGTDVASPRAEVGQSGKHDVHTSGCFSATFRAEGSRVSSSHGRWVGENLGEVHTVGCYRIMVVNARKGTDELTEKLVRFIAAHKVQITCILDLGLSARDLRACLKKHKVNASDSASDSSLGSELHFRLGSDTHVISENTPPQIHVSHASRRRRKFGDDALMMCRPPRCGSSRPSFVR